MTQIHDQASGSYIDQQRAKHARKPVPTPDERRVLVVGGSEEGSIGHSCAQQLRYSGYQVDAPPRDLLDLADDEDRSDWIDGDYDTLVLCNGWTHIDWIENQRPIDIIQAVEENLTLTMIAVSEWVAATLDTPVHKHLVMMGSMAHRLVHSASAPYCAAKAGLDHFNRCMGWELTPKGYSTFVVHPANVAGTPMTRQVIEDVARLRGLSQAEAYDYWNTNLLKDRPLAAHDVAACVAWLCSGLAGYLSGSHIEMPGGQR